MNKKIYVFLCLFAFLTSSCSSASGKTGYQINVKINNLANDTLYLAYHFGEKQYMKDTLRLDSKGAGAFEGKEALPGGFYLVVFPKKNYFEIIVNEQFFFIENDTFDFQKNFKSTGSVENKIFYEDIAFISAKHKERQALDKTYKEAEGNKEKQEEIKSKLKTLDEDVKSYRKKILKDHPETFYAKFLKSLEDVEIPECPKGDDGKCLDSLFDYNYYKAHYFANIDMTDDRMLRTPTFHKKVMDYLERVLPPAPDSLSVGCTVILEKARPNKEMFKYWLISLLNHYANSKIMCQEAVYVHLVENYYAKGDATWTAEEDLTRITDRAKKLKPTLCGKVAPNMNLRDTNNHLIPLNSVKAKYTMLYFYSPDCGHCKKETPQMLKSYRKVVDTMGVDLKVYAAPTMHLHKGDYDDNNNPVFSTDPKDKAEWTDFIKEYKMEPWINVADLFLQDNFRANYDINSTPIVLLLDAEKKILAKRFSPEQLPKIIEDLERRAKKSN